MSSARLLHILTARVVVMGPIVVVMCVGTFFLSAYGSFPEMADTESFDDAAEYAWNRPAGSVDPDWSVFSAPGAGSGSAPNSLLKEFRLAGTFFFDSDRGVTERKAIIDRLSDKSQHVAGEGEVIGEVVVLRVFRDRVILKKGPEEIDLWLSFAHSGLEESADRQAPEDRFGVRVISEYGRILSRRDLLDYYSELRREPERLVDVFKSLEPVYDDNRKIDGYRLNVVGEQDFFTATGLKQGDVIRRVNSMKMSSRKRAEYLIGEFVKDRVNVFYMDIKRGNSNLKLQYYVR